MMSFSDVTQHLLEVVVAITFGAWAWVVKTLGTQHVATIKDVVYELKELRMEMMKLAERVHAVELRQEWDREAKEHTDGTI